MFSYGLYFSFKSADMEKEGNMDLEKQETFPSNDETMTFNFP